MALLDGDPSPLLHILAREKGGDHHKKDGTNLPLLPVEITEEARERCGRICLNDPKDI